MVLVTGDEYAVFELWLEDFIVLLDDVVGEISVEGCVESFGHNVSDILLGGNIFDCETIVFFDLVMDPMVFDVHVS